MANKNFKKFEHANKESSYAAADSIMKENEARCDGEGKRGSAGTLWSKIEKNTGKIAIQSFTVQYFNLYSWLLSTIVLLPVHAPTIRNLEQNHTELVTQRKRTRRILVKKPWRMNCSFVAHRSLLRGAPSRTASKRTVADPIRPKISSRPQIRWELNETANRGGRDLD